MSLKSLKRTRGSLYIRIADHADQWPNPDVQTQDTEEVVVVRNDQVECGPNADQVVGNADQLVVIAHNEAIETPVTEASFLNLPRPDLSPRTTVSWWRDDYREKWGQLANELADQDFPFPTDEAEAFRRIVEEAGGLENIPAVNKRPGEPRGQLRAWMLDDRLSVSMVDVHASIDRQ
jgi:hypothetical protein